ncbi:MAG: glucuronate isomerase [Anaerolineae bacterium]|jgi:glucuronate isomerase|nr:glucuronate isomerase [Anaerolineae bacterium]MBT7072859.1 glucuronate isomerase [Anaerolineae bacterium]MBT7326310.1 glucuronate isomerase [Anaerolineae bacterium]
MNPSRFFSPDPTLRKLAQELYEPVENLPIISPHGHVDPRLFADLNASFGTPADLFIIPDHYVTRMLYSQGIPYEALLHGDHRKIWQLFCANFHLFHGTPSGIWLKHELYQVFGIEETPSAANANNLYDLISEKLASPAFSPRRLFERFNIEILATTDAATDTLEHHQAIRQSGWDGQIIPTFRPDAVVNLNTQNWQENIAKLSEVSGVDIVDYTSYIQALEERRAFFKSMGATATDHACVQPATVKLTLSEADAIFQRALREEASPEDATAFTAHMLLEMARMSTEDGMVMQLHAGSFRNHNSKVFSKYGADKGFDIPIQVEFTQNLRALLQEFGSHPNLTLILFNLDETTYTRELAPLAGVYPSVKIGPPWWFHDSLNGMTRYFDQVMETAGIYNTAGFNDDTRAFASIPARHDLWRRASANWVAGMVARHIIDIDDAHTMLFELSVGLAKRAYKLDK